MNAKTAAPEQLVPTPGCGAESEPLLRIDRLTRRYGAGAPVLSEVSFDVADGEVLCVVGPSGAGKTTLLRCVAGLLPPSDGSLLVAGEPLAGPRQDLAVVFQDYSRSLMPWLTVRENVALPLRRRHSRRDRRRRADEALAAVGLAGHEDKLPWQMSGGMQQRAAIARTLAFRPRLLLMDEPFASVDAQTRANLEDLVLRVRQEFGLTILVVTHDIDEAVYLGDRVVVLGGSPTHVLDILDVPLGRHRDQAATKATAEFTGLRTRLHDYVMH